MDKRNTFQKTGAHRVRLISSLFILLMVILVNGCHKEITNPSSNGYLLSFNQDNIFLLQSIETMLTPLEPLYPQATGIKDHAAYSVQVFSINYKTHYRGSEITASGLVCIPLASEKFPVISFQNGTNTLHENAPSANPLNYNYLILEAMASNGYIIVIPDYIGFGASSDLVHPYYQKESTATSVIDMMHACNELLLNKTVLAKGNDKYYLMGYSQGGWATLSVLEQLEKSGQTDISVTAASCGAGAYDLLGMSEYVLALDTFPSPVYLPYFIYSEQEYGTLTEPLSKFFNQPYADRIPSLFDGTHSNTDIDANLNDTISRLITADMISNLASGPDFQSLRTALTENSVSPWLAKASIRFYHGTADINVPPVQSQQIYAGFITAGCDPNKVTHVDLEGLTHEAGVIPWGINTINWFNQLEGK
jgi:pimeloyl-ACP methyl ester carboxylesterase